MANNSIKPQQFTEQASELTPQMVTVEIEGKPFQVPAGVTLMKAMWYAGKDVLRGAGCLGGFCGACATYYRTKDDPKVKTCLACSMAVEDGMSFSFMPAFPARKAIYNLQSSKIRNRIYLNSILKPRCVGTVMPAPRPVRKILMFEKGCGKRYLVISRRSRTCSWTVSCVGCVHPSVSRILRLIWLRSMPVVPKACILRRNPKAWPHGSKRLPMGSIKKNGTESCNCLMKNCRTRQLLLHKGFLPSFSWILLRNKISFIKPVTRVEL